MVREELDSFYLPVFKSWVDSSKTNQWGFFECHYEHTGFCKLDVFLSIAVIILVIGAQMAAFLGSGGASDWFLNTFDVGPEVSDSW